MSLYSAYWYRVENLKPRLRSHARLYRHHYRSQRWYVVHDASSGRHHRFNKAAYVVIGLMNGERTVQEIWDIATQTLGDAAPTQDEVISLLGRLHGTDVLQCDVSPDTMEMFSRLEQQQGKQWKQRLSNPFALRFPLIDPDRFLSRWMFLVKPLFGWIGLTLWLVTVGAAVLLALLNWPELTGNIADRVLTPSNLLLLWLTYPVIKLLHEMGHSFATRIWGGEVHEMGIMFLALTPIPYVEASASAAFVDKKRRIAVAASGMAVELFIAAMALFIWLNVESGVISSVAYNVMLIGGISTVLFNGNPLLRFDGYYVLADAIEIPNLAQRSTKYLGYLLQRYLFAIEDASSPVTAAGEPAWFIVYGIAAFIYRIFILAALTLFISSKFFIIGILIAIWALSSQIVIPTVRNCIRFYNSIGGRRKRSRFIIASSSLGLSVLFLLFVLPVPLKTVVEGIVWLPEQSQVRAGTDCTITALLVDSHSPVRAGQPLLQCEDPFLLAEVRVLEATLKENQARSDGLSLMDRVQKQILKDEIATVAANLARTRQRQQELIIRSPREGLFLLPEAETLMDRLVQQGDLLGYIMSGTQSTALVVVDQSAISMVRERTKKVSIRLAERLNAPMPSSISREIPAAGKRLPSPVLGSAGGGAIPVDPADPDRVRTLKDVFQIELILPIDQQAIRLGERVYACFDHGYQPLAFQWYRSLRRLFLRVFYV